MSYERRVPIAADCREIGFLANEVLGMELSPRTSLDPDDWTSIRRQGHIMLDDMLDHLENLSSGRVWSCPSETARAAMCAPLPLAPTDLASVHTDFRETILPFGSGNTHPGFMGWAQGGGTAVGMLAEMLAAGLNANLGGRDHMPLAVERQIVAWVRDMFGFPPSADGLFLTGASQANFVALLIARSRACGDTVRTRGVAECSQLVAYTSTEAHGCIPRAMEMAGLGTANLRMIPSDERHCIRLDALHNQIARDLAAGLVPFMVIGTAGTVNSGAIDDLKGLAEIASERGLHFHVDGALGALGVISDELAPLFAGIEQCDSLAFDFHKWGQVPYDAGFLLVRDGSWQRQTFASEAAYLSRAKTGLAGGEWWPSDLGPDLSRGFRALKTWFTLKTYGLSALAASISASCKLAQELAERIAAEPDLHLFAPVALNIVCFGYHQRGAAADPTVNAKIVEQLHAAGAVAPSLTLINGQQAIRAAFVNHRTTTEDVRRLVDGVLALGAANTPQRKAF